MNITNPELLIGLVALAFGVGFGLRGFGKGITSELRDIKETVIAIQETADKTWDLILNRFAPSSGTVERELENLGKVKISAEPGEKETRYLIEIEKPILIEGLLFKLTKESGLLKKEQEMFGSELKGVILSRTRMRIRIPCTDPKLCTEYITLFLKWLSMTYVNSLGGIKDYEEPILT